MILMEDRYEKIRRIAEKELSSSAHDPDHVMRVYALCSRLSEGVSGVDLHVLKTAALLHDIARAKEDQDKSRETDHAILGAETAGKILLELGYSLDEIKRIQHCIVAHRFRSGVRPQTIEAKILFDADKLDVLGAIGTARSYIIAGENGEKIYSDVSIDDYIRNNLQGGRQYGRIRDVSKHAPNIEFETKFKHIPEILYTEKARVIANERLEFMTQFFERLKRELQGEV